MYTIKYFQFSIANCNILIVETAETAAELETGPLSSMEDRQEQEKCIMVQEQGHEIQKQPANMNVQNSTTVKEENCVRAEQGEKGNVTEELKKEMQVEAEVKVELCQSVPGLQLNFIQGSDLFGYVGIEAVLDQMRSKTMKAGFEFNIMVVGESHTNNNKNDCYYYLLLLLLLLSEFYHFCSSATHWICFVIKVA